MRRRTKAGPIGGALVCNVISGAATSGGSRPGKLAMNCATFITGPRRFPRTAVRSCALVALNRAVPPSERAAPRAATPVNPAETRANRVSRRANPSSRSSAGASVTRAILYVSFTTDSTISLFGRAALLIALVLLSQSGTLNVTFTVTGDHSAKGKSA